MNLYRANKQNGFEAGGEKNAPLTWQPYNIFGEQPHF